MKALTRYEERVLALVAAGDPWAGVHQSRKLRAGRLATLRRLARRKLIEPGDRGWQVTVYGRAYHAAARVEQRTPTH